MDIFLGFLFTEQCIVLKFDNYKRKPNCSIFSQCSRFYDVEKHFIFFFQNVKAGYCRVSENY
jgi:hypothetical protein